MRTFNISEIYVDNDDPQTGILAATSFTIRPTTSRFKGYSMVQLVFGRDIILPIKHKVDWQLIRQKNQSQNNKDNMHEKSKRVYHDFKVGYKVILNNRYVYKFETPYK